MKKTLFAFVVLGASAGAATAQSSVTIYGLVDMGLTKSNSGTSPNPGRGTPNTWAMQQGISSRLGFKGVEDLGGGMYARFNLETRFAPDTGALSYNTFWGQNSVVAIGSKTLGEVYMGRDYTPAFWVALAADPTSWNYVSQLGLMYEYANYNGSATNVGGSNATSMDYSGVRRSNTVGYKSIDMNGFSSELALALGENNRHNTKGANLQYNNGPVYLGAAYDGMDGNDRLYVVTAGYDLGIVRPVISFANAKGGTPANYSAKSASFTLSAPVASGKLYGGIGHLITNDTNNHSTKIFTGYEYPLSKRTTLYTNVGSAQTGKLNRSTAFDLGMNHRF